jgi:hypothetical protein
VAEPLVDAGHSNQDDREMGTVVFVSGQLERGGREALFNGFKTAL